MTELIILFVLCFAGAVSAVVFIVFSISFLIKRRKTEVAPETPRLRRSAAAFLIVAVMTGIFLGISQSAAHTPSIDAEGSVAELIKIDLNGRGEWISVRGINPCNPVLLFLAGGPGGTQMAAVRHDLADLERHFTVVVWDQPGSGKSYAAAKNLTVETYIEDGYALTRYLHRRFHQEKIYLVGESWGSALAVFLAARYPESYHAVVGTGQMVDFLETERIDYEKALEIAESRGDTAKINRLKANGPPPYYGSDVTRKSAEYLNYLSAYMASDPEIRNNGFDTFRDIFSEEYGIIDKINFLLGIVTTFNRVYPMLYGVDLRKDYPKLEVPIYFFLGRHDVNAPLSLAEEYFEILEAPKKKIVWFEHSGHNPWKNESEKFIAELAAIAADTEPTAEDFREQSLVFISKLFRFRSTE